MQYHNNLVKKSCILVWAPIFQLAKCFFYRKSLMRIIADKTSYLEVPTKRKPYFRKCLEQRRYLLSGTIKMGSFWNHILLLL